jgi:hypothetical protein
MDIHSCNPKTHRRWRQEDLEFKTSLGYIVKFFLKTNKQTNKQKQQRPLSTCLTHMGSKHLPAVHSFCCITNLASVPSDC